RPELFRLFWLRPAPWSAGAFLGADALGWAAGRFSFSPRAVRCSALRASLPLEAFRAERLSLSSLRPSACFSRWGRAFWALPLPLRPLGFWGWMAVRGFSPEPATVLAGRTAVSGPVRK